MLRRVAIVGSMTSDEEAVSAAHKAAAMSIAGAVIPGELSGCEEAPSIQPGAVPGAVPGVDAGAVDAVVAGVVAGAAAPRAPTSLMPKAAMAWRAASVSGGTDSTPGSMPTSGVDIVPVLTAASSSASSQAKM
mmetsp:Transcript_53032/g.141778  ORF Transcript_53032/g.141778 Transcript_53032/m.141778 type:complete len:133 (-) Transcript_53032:22-420(-)